MIGLTKSTNKTYLEINKMEIDMESIHNEHRRDNLHIFSDIENLKLDVRSIDTHISYLKDEKKKSHF